jgi:hypothetical protein
MHDLFPGCSLRASRVATAFRALSLPLGLSAPHFFEHRVTGLSCSMERGETGPLSVSMFGQVPGTTRTVPIEEGALPPEGSKRRSFAARRKQAASSESEEAVKALSLRTLARTLDFGRVMNLTRTWGRSLLAKGAITGMMPQ